MEDRDCAQLLKEIAFAIASWEGLCFGPMRKLLKVYPEGPGKDMIIMFFRLYTEYRDQSWQKHMKAELEKTRTFT